MRQILFAGAIGLFLTLVGTPLLIKLLARKGYGQFIRDDGPRSHDSKKGTPTMGGIAFILATLDRVRAGQGDHRRGPDASRVCWCSS